MKIEPGASVTPNVRLVRPIGEGGMGEVWLAEHLALGTEVAVKFLLGDYAKDAAARSRFSQEAAAASQVKSSHVVKVYDYGITDDDVPFIVMEMLEGTDIREAPRDRERKSRRPSSSPSSHSCARPSRARTKKASSTETSNPRTFS